MRNATRVTVSTFGALAGLAGIEHGVGEILQGNVAPDGIVIASWPESELFRVLNGEPAMTIVPNLLAAGVLTVLVSVGLLVWATAFVQRRHGGLVLVLLSLVLLLVGGGFGPPLLGAVLGVVATRIDAPLTWWQTRVPLDARRLLGGLWPWSFGAALIAWLWLFAGLVLLDYFFSVDSPAMTVSVIVSAFGLLATTVLTGFAHDAQQRWPERATVAPPH